MVGHVLAASSPQHRPWDGSGASGTLHGHQMVTEHIYLPEPSAKQTRLWMFSVGGFLEFRTKQKKTGTISLWPSSVQQMAVSDQESGAPATTEMLPYKKRTSPWGVQGN